MIRNLKVLGLALAAVFAMSAVAASSAWATPEWEFHSEIEPTGITGAQVGTDVFHTDGGEVTCKKASYIGTVATNPTTTVEVTPTYSECHLVFIFTFNVTIHHNGCTYLFHATEKVVTANETHYEGKVDIVCPTGKVIEVTAPSCTVTVPPQTGLTKVTFTNKIAEGKEHVEVDVNLTGITYEEHGGACASETEHTTNGTYTGKATVKGYQDNSGVHGAQTNIWVA